MVSTASYQVNTSASAQPLRRRLVPCQTVVCGCVGVWVCGCVGVWVCVHVHLKDTWIQT